MKAGFPLELACGGFLSSRQTKGPFSGGGPGLQAEVAGALLTKRPR